MIPLRSFECDLKWKQWELKTDLIEAIAGGHFAVIKGINLVLTSGIFQGFLKDGSTCYGGVWKYWQTIKEKRWEF